MKKFFEKTTNLFGNKWLLFAPVILFSILETVRFFVKPSIVPWDEYLSDAFFAMFLNVFGWIGWWYIFNKNTDPYESDQEIADDAAADLNDGNLFMLLQAAVKQAIGTIQFAFEPNVVYRTNVPIDFPFIPNSVNHFQLDCGELTVSMEKSFKNCHGIAGKLEDVTQQNWPALLKLADQIEKGEYEQV